MPSGRTSPRPDQLAAGEAEAALEEGGIRVRVGPRLACGLLELTQDVLGGAHHGHARERRRAARAGRAVVRREARVGAADDDRLGLDPEHLGGDLRERGARALAHLGRAGEDRDAAVGLHAHDGRRDGCAPAASRPDRDAAPDERRLRLAPADRRRCLLDVADQVGVEGLAAEPDLLAGRAQVPAPDLEAVDAAAACDLVDLALADPLQVRRAERPVAAGGRGVRVDAARVDAERLPAVGAGRGVAAGGGHARAVVGVRARVEPALDVAPEQAAVARRGRAHARRHAVAARGDHRLPDAVLDAHGPPRLARQRDRDRLHLRVRLRAEPAAQVGHDHAHRRERAGRRARRSRPARGTGAGSWPRA